MALLLVGFGLKDSIFDIGYLQYHELQIYDGDIIFIQSSPVVENGQIAAVAVDDEATLKYFYQYGDTVVLRPANAKYEEMTYSREDLDHLRILGRAVAFQSGL